MKVKKAFWGIFFILSGMFLIVSRLGYFPDINIFSLILTIFLIACIIESVRHLHFSGILFPIAFICIIFDKALGITSITPWPVLGAALFGSIGLSIIFHNHNHYKRYKKEEHFEEIINQEDGESFRLETNFSSSLKYVNSDNFSQASLKCSFGAMKVYFDHATIQNENAVIQLDISFAGVELFLPKEWKVIDHTQVSFGGIEEKNADQSVGRPTITLVGNVSFSGVTIIYV